MTIEVKNLVKKFGSFAALDGVDLKVNDGELLALLGPSGSGKTTLLRIIAGLDWPDSGEVSFNGEDALAQGARERHVGFVFQHYALFRHMSVFENVAFGLRVQPRAVRKDEATIRRRVKELLDLVQLDWLADRYPSQLSGGQRQRIALARALAIEPRILLLDEPFGALDAKVRKELRKWLRSLHHEINVTSIFVTHDQEEALEVANRVVVMDKGKIEQIGSPDDVYETPATAFVHGFIGESIELPVQVDGGVVRLGDRPLNLAADGLVSGASKLFVRRHDMLVGPPGSGAFEGAVQHVRNFGPVQRAEVALSGGETIEIDAPRDRDCAPGTASVSIPAATASLRGPERVEFSSKFTFQPRLVCNNGPSSGGPNPCALRPQFSSLCFSPAVPATKRRSSSRRCMPICRSRAPSSMLRPPRS